MKISVVSGGFDPIHSGHIAYLDAASKLGEKLIVLLNSDEWLRDKKGHEFMPFNERQIILQSIKSVSEVFDFKDDSEGSCINGLKKIQSLYPSDEIIFCNGGDRNKSNIPEMKVEGIQFVFGVGGNNKLNSSSWILKNWSYPSEKRVWGEFFNLFEDTGVKVKELVVQPRSGMSFQRHFKRNEIWLISSGECIINFSEKDANDKQPIHLKKFDHFFVKVQNWHQITNPFNEICKIIEIQFGEDTIEDDIERLEYYES